MIFIRPSRLFSLQKCLQLPPFDLGCGCFDEKGAATAGADQLSAMPSVHVAWSIIVAWAVITRSTSRWRWLILLHPVITVLVVVGTGNHYWADAIVAAAIDAAVISTVTRLTRRLRAARVPQPVSEPEPSAAASSGRS